MPLYYELEQGIYSFTKRYSHRVGLCNAKSALKFLIKSFHWPQASNCFALQETADKAFSQSNGLISDHVT